MTELVSLPGGEGWRIGDTTFVQSFEPTSSSERFSIRKPQSLIDLYVEMAAEIPGATLVELGIAAGGGTALLALLARPQRLVAIDLNPDPIAALTAFITRHQLEGVVTPFYGIDQGDRSVMTELIERAVGRDPVDVVIDDASHLYAETLASFEVLYPRVRPGGRFIIEDWAADYAYAERVAANLSGPPSAQRAALEQQIGNALTHGSNRPRPLPRLGVELLHLAGSSPDVVARVEINRHWICVERGPATLDPSTFRLAHHYTDHWGWLADELR